MLLKLFLAVLVRVLHIAAAPHWPQKREVTDLTSDEISAFTIPAYLAQAAYCPSYTIENWDCGVACDSIPPPSVLTVGGDGGATPRYFVLTQNYTVYVAISGTNTSNDASIAIDLEIPRVGVDPTLFPDSSGIQLHQGSYETFLSIQPDILAAVQGGIDAGAFGVFVIGHSLGGALTQITATYLQQQMPDTLVFAQAFAPPRVGNQRWADYVDQTLGVHTQHLINYSDDVPHVPPRSFGYVHNSGEIWILKDGVTYEACSGQENPNCSDTLETFAGDLALVASFVDDFDEVEHRGPYAGVLITIDNCAS